MRTANNIAIVIPLANEASHIDDFAKAINAGTAGLQKVTIYFVIDGASKDETLDRCQNIALTDSRYQVIFEPRNRHVVDAYFRGFRQAVENNHDLIIEMDGGLSHDPLLIPEFVRAYEAGADCVFGSRFMDGSVVFNYGWRRRALSVFGTFISKLLLGGRLKDMTSGFEAFDVSVMKKLLKMKIRSKGHFIQTEIRYLCWHERCAEIPISYNSPSKSVSAASVQNAVATLLYYFARRITFRPIKLP